MSRWPSFSLSAVALASVLAGGVVLTHAPGPDPLAPPAEAGPAVAVAPRAGTDATDYAPPRGVVDPPAGHAARVETDFDGTDVPPGR